MSRGRLILLIVYSAIFWSIAALVWSPDNPIHGFAAIGFASFGVSLLLAGLMLHSSIPYVVWLIISWAIPSFVMAFALRKRSR